jgi:hypothetical protein
VHSAEYVHFMLWWLCKEDFVRGQGSQLLNYLLDRCQIFSSVIAGCRVDLFAKMSRSIGMRRSVKGVDGVF